MRSFNTIVLATDFGDSMKPILDRAVYLSKNFDAQLVPLHVVEDSPEYPFFHVDKMKRLTDEVSSKMEEFVKELVATGVRVPQSLIQEGKPQDTILSTATKLNVDMIVLGAGRKNFIERFFGSTAEKVVRKAYQPVWTVHPGEAVSDVRHVVCAVDFTQASEGTLHDAIGLCQSLHCRLTVLHVYNHKFRFDQLQKWAVLPPPGEFEPSPYPIPNEIDESEILDRENDEFIEYLGKFDFGDLKVDHQIEHGEPADDICEIANGHHCDLLIMGVTNRNEASVFFLGGTIESVLRNVRCSILTIKHRDDFGDGADTVVIDRRHN